MKRKIWIFIAVIVVLVGVWYFTMGRGATVPEEAVVEEQYEIYSKEDLGFEFKYRTSPNGYVYEELDPSTNTPNLLKIILLFLADDYINLLSAEPGGEGPAIIVVQVFKNPKKQTPLVWANENKTYSNINLKTGEVTDTTIAGVPAVRYMADGLYASENVVVANGDKMYVFTGQYLTEDSELRRDFAPLLDSVKFLTKVVPIPASTP